jgi:hypothetical protein
MKNALFLTAENIICLALVPVEIFLIIKSATPDKAKEKIYTRLSVFVLSIMIILITRYLKNII